MTTPPPGPTPLPTPASPVGRMLGPWRLEAQLGEGATSTVWAASDQARGLRVALKILKSDEVDEAIAQRRQLRMMRESEALVRSAHPNVVRIVEVGRVGARVYLAMELIQGVDLRTWLSQRRAWPEVVGVYLQCARGLAAAHKAGIIHRDFKPANVMLEHTGRAVVTDFGLARGEVPELEGGALAIKLTAGGVAVGTPRYMAPEQHQAAATDARTDQFALGVALFEALYGQHPYAPAPRQDVSASVAYALAALGGRLVTPPEPVPPLPPELATAVRRAIALAPDERFRDLDGLIAALEAVLAQHTRQGRRGHRVFVAGAAALVASAAALAAVWWSGTPAECRAEPRPLLAEAAAWSEWWARAHAETCAAARAPGAEARRACLARERAAVEALVALRPKLPERAARVALSAALETRCALEPTSTPPAPSAPPRDVAAAVEQVAREGSPEAWAALLALLASASTHDVDGRPVEVAPDALTPDADTRAARREALALVLLGFERRTSALLHLARALDDARALDRTAAGSGGAREAEPAASERTRRLEAELTEAELSTAAAEAGLGELPTAESRLSATLARLGRTDASPALHVRALEARAWVRMARGAHAEATTDARDALARARDALGDGHPLTLGVLYALGTAEALGGASTSGLPKLEEAARRRSGPRKAEVLLTLSRALAAAQPERARALADEAATAATGDAALVRAIEGWRAALAAR